MAILRELLGKIKMPWKSTHQDIFLVIIIFLVSLASFGLGRLSVFYGDAGGVEILYPENYQEGTVFRTFDSEAADQAAREAPLPAAGGEYVASRTGSKYHFPWCPGAQQMKEENKIWFASKQDAEAAGYTPAANCKGL